MWRLVWIGVLLAAGCESTPDRLDVQHSAWKEAQREGTAEAFEQFVAVHPESWYAREARERAAYIRAMDEESPEALEQLLQEYPEARFFDRAQVEWTLERQWYWRSCEDPGGPAAETYLERYPDGPNSQRVLDRLRQERFDQARSAGTPQALAHFAGRFPGHALTEKAQLLQLELETELRGLAALAAAESVHLVVDYRPPSQGDDRDRRPPWLEGGLVEPARAFLRHAGLREVEDAEADVVVQLRLQARWLAMQYWGGARVFVPNAGIELQSSLEVRAGDDAVVRREAGVREEPPDQKTFLQRDDQPIPDEMVLAHGPQPEDLLARAGTVRELAEVLVEARGVELLLTSLLDESGAVWPRSKAILLDLANEDTLAPLRELLRADGMRSPRRAVLALEGWWHPDEDADERERLAFQLFQSEDPPAPEGFGQASLPLASAVLLETEHGLGSAEVRAAAVLGSIGAPAVEVLIAAFDTPDDSLDDSRTRAIAAALHAIGEPAVEPLLTTLGHENDNVREATVFTLGLLRPPSALAALERVAATDRDPARWAAVDAVARIRVDPLIEQLESPDPERRQRAVFELRGIDEPRVLSAFSRALEDENTLVRRQTIECLRLSKDPTAVDALIDALGDPEGSVRMDAARALGWVGDVRALEPLIEQLADSDRLAREAAVWALGQLGDARAIEPLRALPWDPVDEVRERVQESLEALGAAPPEGGKGY